MIRGKNVKHSTNESGAKNETAISLLDFCGNLRVWGWELISQLRQRHSAQTSWVGSLSDQFHPLIFPKYLNKFPEHWAKDLTSDNWKMAWKFPQTGGCVPFFLHILQENVSRIANAFLVALWVPVTKPSLSEFEFLNLSGIVNCVAVSLGVV